MASLATCPLCAKQLAIPEGTSSDDRAECPECDATFLLSNAFQTSLPTARILSSTEPPPVPEVTPQQSVPLTQDLAKENEENPPSEVNDAVSLASWESRLKNAIERDAAELVDPQPTGETPTTETLAAEQSKPLSPEFDFQIDPPLAEQTLETEKPPVRDFDQAELPASESVAWAPPPTQESVSSKQDATDLFTETIEKEPEVAAAVKEPSEAELAEADELTLGLSNLHPRRSRRFSPLKLAAVLIGPGLIGVFLGLYALLWIKGPSGDLINLARYLPTAMLPPMATTPEAKASQETAQPPEDAADLLVQEVPTVEQDIDQDPAAAQPTEPRRDDAIRMAAAEQPAPPVLTALPDEFGELLAAARAAEPGLVDGDLGTNEAVSQKGHAYMTICQLAQRFDLIRTPQLDAQSQAEIASAKELFDSMASDSSALGDLAAIASRWWGYESRPNQGIFFAGQIQNIQPLGDQTLCHVALDEPMNATVIPVLLDQASAGESDRIVVVGSIVSEPKNSLSGFSLDLPQVVVAPYSRVLQP